MPVPSTIVDISSTASSNSPSGSDLIGNTLDEYLRAIQAILKQQCEQGADIASASTIVPLADGNTFDVTGTTTITGISSTYSWNGRIIVLKFDGVLSITHNSSSMVLPGSTNITTAAGDTAVFKQEVSGQWRCINYQYRNGGVVNGGMEVNGLDFTTARETVRRWSADTGSAALLLFKSRGATVGTYSNVQNGDEIGSIIACGAGSGSDVTSARLRFEASENWSSSSAGCEARILTTPNGSTTPASSMHFRQDGTIVSLPIYNSTTASAANVFVNSGGLLARSTSTLNLKENVEAATYEDAEAFVKNAEVIWYRSSCENDRKDWSHYGLAAEQIAGINPRFVNWGYLPEHYDDVVVEKDGEKWVDKVLKPHAEMVPVGVAYDRVALALLLVVQKQMFGIDNQNNLSDELAGLVQQYCPDKK